MASFLVCLLASTIMSYCMRAIAQNSAATTDIAAGLIWLPAPVDAGAEPEAEDGVPDEVGDPEVLDIKYISPEASEDTKIRP
jgi:hypothetical protein